MSINEFKSKVNLIKDFVCRLDEETIPFALQKNVLKIFANTLNINLTDTMINNILEDTSFTL